MNEPNQLFGLMFGYGCSPQQQQTPISQTFLQQAYDAMRSVRPVADLAPEEARKWELEIRNRDNYARWLARINRDPLQDCEAR